MSTIDISSFENQSYTHSLLSKDKDVFIKGFLGWSCTRSCNLILLSSLFHPPHSSLKSLHRYLETCQLYLKIIFPRYVIPISITRLFPSPFPILDLFAPLVLCPSLSLVDILSSLHLQVANEVWLPCPICSTVGVSHWAVKSILCCRMALSINSR